MLYDDRAKVVSQKIDLQLLKICEQDHKPVPTFLDESYFVFGLKIRSDEKGKFG